MNQRRALIFGVMGQDGAYLARLLCRHKYQVHGTTRHSPADTTNLRRLSSDGDVTVHSISPLDGLRIKDLIETIAPAEIYYLAGEASVATSFRKPVEAVSSHAIGILNVMEAMRAVHSSARLFNASSSEIFGQGSGTPASEVTAVLPRTPYGVAKAASTSLVAIYREAYGLFVCSGILFPHESPLRPASYVTMKIVQGALAIAHGRESLLALGNLEVVRDWGWAPEYVEGMWRTLEQTEPRDLVIATGVASPLKDFVECVFGELGLRWQDHVMIDQSLLRPSDVSFMVGNPSLAYAVLGWSAKTHMPEIAVRLVRAVGNGTVD